MRPESLGDGQGELVKHGRGHVAAQKGKRIVVLIIIRVCDGGGGGGGSGNGGGGMGR